MLEPLNLAPSVAVVAIQLDSYQEQSHLLDPYLERMVLPPLNAFRQHVRAIQSDTGVHTCGPRLTRLVRLIYWYTKTRGEKVIGASFDSFLAI